MELKKRKVKRIIHSTSVAAGGIGAGLAKLPGADMPVLCTLQQAMIIEIGNVYGHKLTSSEAKNLLLTFLAGYFGKALAGYLVGWLPGFGSLIKAGTAVAITETVGWSANDYFAKRSVIKA